MVCCNFTPVPRHGYPVGVPAGGWYQEIFNSDSEHYDGSNVGNYPGVAAEPTAWNGRPHSIRITLPPLAAVIFKPQAAKPQPDRTAIQSRLRRSANPWPLASAGQHDLSRFAGRTAGRYPGSARTVPAWLRR